MKFSKITAALLAATLGFSTVAGAQPHQPRGDAPGPQRQQTGPQGPSHQPAGPRAVPQQPARGPAMQAPGRPVPPVARGAGPERQFHKGQRLPREWRNRQYVVDNWRAHGLTPPPRGHQWVQVGADFVLIAVGTGIITSLILSH